MALQVLLLLAKSLLRVVGKRSCSSKSAGFDSAVEPRSSVRKSVYGFDLLLNIILK